MINGNIYKIHSFLVMGQKMLISVETATFIMNKDFWKRYILSIISVKWCIDVITYWC